MSASAIVAVPAEPVIAITQRDRDILVGIYRATQITGVTRSVKGSERVAVREPQKRVAGTSQRNGRQRLIIIKIETVGPRYRQFHILVDIFIGGGILQIDINCVGICVIHSPCVDGIYHQGVVGTGAYRVRHFQSDIGVTFTPNVGQV